MAMVRITKTVKTRAEAEARQDWFFRAYHPAGYGTTLKIVENEDGTFTLAGYRYSSCD